MQSDDAKSTAERALKGEQPKRKRSERRAVLHMEVSREAREAFFRRVRAAGVSGPEYFAHAIARPERTYHTDAVLIAKPLADISYRLSRAVDALRKGDVPAGIAAVVEAQRVVASALSPLRRAHDESVRDNTDRLRD